METDNNVALERLSDLMLKGWIMTNDTCFATTHTAPRMRLKGRTENWCVICDEAKIISNGGLLKPRILPNTIKEMATTTTTTDKIELSKETENTKDAQPINVKEATQPLSRARRDDISRLLGEKMLQGWTLMEMACSMDGCVGVPLMKDTSGQLHCVSCYNITNKIAPPPVNTQTVNEPILNTSNNDINNTSNGPSLNAVNLTKRLLSDSTIVESTPLKQKSRVHAQSELESPSLVEFTSLNDKEILLKTRQSVKVALGRLLPQLEQCESPSECAQIAAAISGLVGTLKMCTV